MKTVRKTRMRLSLKQVSRAYAGLIVILSIGLTVFFNFNNSKKSYGFTTGEYRSVASGNWNAVTTWQKWNGSAWIAATVVPSSSGNVITIQSGHIVTVTAAATVDQVVVSFGGTLVLNSGITLTLANGTGTDLDVSGIFKNAGSVILSGSVIVFQFTGKYQHNYTNTGGVIPTATWNAGSTCEIIGYTGSNTAPTGMQAFSNFVWNCPGQTLPINLGTALTSSTFSGNINIVSTGTQALILSNISGTINITGNIVQSGGTLILNDISGSNVTLNLTGNFIQNAGVFSTMIGSNSNGIINMLAGNWTRMGGLMTVGGNSLTNTIVNFAKPGIQSFISGSDTVLGNVDFLVKSGATLNLGTNILTGRNFTVAAGGVLMIGSNYGISDTGAVGNIQVLGTRTFNAAADYQFTGSATQVTGSAFPTTVRNLTLNNASSMVLSKNLTVTNSINFVSGKIFTLSNELVLTNPSPTAISGASNNSYVVGNLRLSVNATGAYTFPLGSALLYQPSTLTLSSALGFTSILGKFNTTNPNDAITLLSLMVSGVFMTEMLDYGSWSFTPNLPMVSGTYTVQLNEKGYSNTLGTTSIYSVLYRANSTLPWSSVGTHNDATQSVSVGVVTAARSSLISFGEFGIAMGDYLSFVNPTLISGVGGTIGAIYKFPSVMRGIDAWVSITDIQGGVTLASIDDPTTGYSEAFQPFINYPANTSGYFQWKIQFKKFGTVTDTMARKMTATGVDVDGSGSGSATIREFVEATMPTSYDLDPATTLTMTNNGGRYRALGAAVTIANIDTAQKMAMYGLNYNNVSWIEYRTGAINTMTIVQTRQTSLYFRKFNLTFQNIALPIELINFDASLKENEVMLNWATATETNNDYFTIERSDDGENFEKVTTQRGSGNSTITRSYQAVDPNPLPGYSYYRLKQTDFDGHYSYSEVQTVKMKGNVNDNQAIEMKSIAPNPFSDKFTVNFITKSKGKAQVITTNSSGSLIAQEAIEVQDGYNTYEYNDASEFQTGIYFVTVIFNDEKVSKKIMKQ